MNVPVMRVTKVPNRLRHWSYLRRLNATSESVAETTDRDSVVLDDVRLAAAIRRANEARGLRLTLERLAECIGKEERTWRRMRKAGRPIETKLAERLCDAIGCELADIVANERTGLDDMMCRLDDEERYAWPVPLSRPEAWYSLIEDIGRSDISVLLPPGNHVVDMGLHDILQTAWSVIGGLTGARETVMFETAKLKEVMMPLEYAGIQLLSGRYMARTWMLNGDSRAGRPQGVVRLRKTLLLTLSRSYQLPQYVVDRSDEPTADSEDEIAHMDDDFMVCDWLDWEGKHRLLFWPEGD